MLNIEYYKYRLADLGIINLDKLAVLQGKPHICKSTRCDECLFTDVSSDCTYSESLNWLFSEYEEEKEEPEVDWSEVKVDTPILVRDILRTEWIKRYFAKFEDGKVYAWMCGATSWTVDDEYDVTFWKYAKLAESEE